MRPNQRGAALVIATIAVLVIAVIGVGILRFASREVAGASSGQRQQALVSCADAARALLLSRFHVIGTQPAEIGVLDVRLDGPGGRQRALGGHIDGDPSQPLVTIRQVEGLPSQATFNGAEMAGDTTNLLLSNTSEAGAGAGQLLKITVHCQEGDLSNSTSGRQMEIEFGVRFGL